MLLLGKTEANLAQVYDEIEAAGHPQPAVIPFNLETALPHQYDELAAMIEKEFGHLDGLLHNASIIGPRTPIEQLSGENFMRVMHVNVNAMFMLTSTLLPLLKPAIVTCAILKGVGVYNEYYAANLYLQDANLKTIAIALYSFTGPMGSKYNLICAGVIITLLPMLILFLIFQKQIYSGIAAGSVKE